jgi:three-Cys-motif partner protein
MAAPKNTIWNLEAHTTGKHLVLRSYLNAWLPILGTWSGRILFIDGFAGPGEYSKGEEGSPIIAMRALEEHIAKTAIKAEIVFIFIEKDKARADHLLTLVEQWRPKLKNCKIDVIVGEFDDKMKDIFGYLDEQKKRLAPSFVMIDPFGVSGTPMSVVKRILGSPRSEVYISVMIESINRFCGTKEFEPHLNELYGDDNWKECAKIDGSTERIECFVNLYEKKLYDAGAKEVVKFDLYERNRYVYTIFFATGHWLGSYKMKAAVWKVAPFGDFAFRGSHSGQLTFGSDIIDFAPLRAALCEEFKGRGWVRIDQVEKFVGSDQTDYHTGQLRKGALIPMEKTNEIEVDQETRKRKNSYPDGCRMRFL